VTDSPEDVSGERPLQRDPALVLLSRDHHFALMHALALRRVSEAGTRWAVTGPVATAEAFLTFYEEELLGHMGDEEEALLPAVEAVDPDNVSRLRREHDELAEQVALLRQALEDGTELRSLMSEIGQMLHDHVRFEERIFFESIQSRLSAEELQRIGEAIEGHRKARGRGEGCALPRRARR